jgi:hypothetical protein
VLLVLDYVVLLVQQPGRARLYNAIANSGKLPCRLERVRKERDEMPEEPK